MPKKGIKVAVKLAKSP